MSYICSFLFRILLLVCHFKNKSQLRNRTQQKQYESSDIITITQVYPLLLHSYLFLLLYVRFLFRGISALWSYILYFENTCFQDRKWKHICTCTYTHNSIYKIQKIYVCLKKKEDRRLLQEGSQLIINKNNVKI